MNGDCQVPVLLMMNRLTYTVVWALTLILAIGQSACERVYPEPPQTYTPANAQELRNYFDNLRYDLQWLEKGVPRLAVTDLPDDFTLIKDVRERKRLFVMTLLPLVLMTNEEILAERRRAERLLAEYQHRGTLEKKDQDWLQALAKRYRLGDAKPGDGAFRKRLLRSVDSLPVSLALAQAANESGWGTSRFALEGNNLFGEWTFIKGAGLVPRERAPGARHEVRLFPNLHESLRSYMLNLNSHRAYAKLRQKREQFRRKGEHPDGPSLATGLKAYSERGDDYIRDIERMIRENRFTLFADAELR